MAAKKTPRAAPDASDREGASRHAQPVAPPEALAFDREKPPSTRRHPGRRATVPEERLPCTFRPRGKPSKKVDLAKLIELLATGQAFAEDEVDFGEGFKPISEIAMLSRYLPRVTQTTRRFEGPGVPDFLGKLPVSSIAASATVA